MSAKLFLSLLPGAVLLVSCLRTSEALAQTTFAIGPRVGGNWSSTRYEYMQPLPTIQEESKTTARPGLTAGVTANLSHRHFVLGVSALFTMKGFVLDARNRDVDQTSAQVTTSYYHQRYRFNYLTFPFTIAYAQYANGQGIQLFGGGYLACLLGGQVMYDNHFDYGNQIDRTQFMVPVKAASSIDYFTSDFHTKRFDVGIQAGLGYRWRPLLVQVAYQIGLRNLGPNYPNDQNRQAAFYTRSTELSATYFWGKLSRSASSSSYLDSIHNPRYSL